jgi:hypothetical protein
MLAFLKDHPFAVDAFFESSLVLTYAIPKEELQLLIPECLQLDTFDDKWAFVAVAMVQTKHLRPRGFPKFMGKDFFLTGYRIFVRYTTSEGKRLRGLHIIRSQTDKKKMEFFGNLFTHYNYTTIDIEQSTKGNIREISSKASGLKVLVETGEAGLPEHSPFSTWKEARRYAGPLPFTFTYNEAKKEVLIIEGVRQNWEPAPVKVLEHKVAFLDELKLKEVHLANAFIINDIPYYWKKGRKDLWKA